MRVTFHKAKKAKQSRCECEERKLWSTSFIRSQRRPPSLIQSNKEIPWLGKEESPTSHDFKKKFRLLCDPEKVVCQGRKKCLFLSSSFLPVVFLILPLCSDKRDCEAVGKMSPQKFICDNIGGFVFITEDHHHHPKGKTLFSFGRKSRQQRSFEQPNGDI